MKLAKKIFSYKKVFFKSLSASPPLRSKSNLIPLHKYRDQICHPEKTQIFPPLGSKFATESSPPRGANMFYFSFRSCLLSKPIIFVWILPRYAKSLWIMSNILHMCEKKTIWKMSKVHPFATRFDTNYLLPALLPNLAPRVANQVPNLLSSSSVEEKISPVSVEHSFSGTWLVPASRVANFCMRFSGIFAFIVGSKL